MYKVLLPVSIILVLTGCLTKTYTPFMLTSNEFKGKYSTYLKKGEVEVNSWYHYVTSKIEKGEYIIRVFFPETRQIISYSTYSSPKTLQKNGLSMTWSDKGHKVSEGYYKNGYKTGEWFYYQGEEEIISRKGNYIKGEKEGIWRNYDEKRRLVSEINFKNNLREGKFIKYDTTSSIINEGFYQADIIMSESNPDTIVHDDILPLMYDCGIKDEEEQRKCSTKKMLQYVYSNIKYPVIARKYSIEGTAIIRFYIDEDGSIKEPEMLRGICQSISDESLRLVKTMPNWYQPGIRDGEKVKVYFNLPIKFRLE